MMLKKFSNPRKEMTMKKEEMDLISGFVDRKLAALGRSILDGNISLDPYERGSESACTYCPYGKVCGFDRAMPGCRPRVIEEFTDAEILQKIEKSAKAWESAED